MDDKQRLVIKQFVTKSKWGVKSDPTIRVDELAKETGLSTDDVLCAAEDLVGYLSKSREIRDEDKSLFAEDLLFVEFDYHFMGWSAKKDATIIITQMADHDNYSPSPGDISKDLDLPLRRVNPAFYWLYQEGLMYESTKVIGVAGGLLEGDQHKIKRFLRGQQY